MKRAILTICLLFAVGAVRPVRADAGDYKQSLIRRLDTTSSDTARLRLLYDLSFLTKSEDEGRLKYVDRMLEEAERQDNDEYRCQAYLSYMCVAYNRYDVDEVNKWMKLLEPLARKEKLYDLLFTGKQCVVDMLLFQERYEFQEKEALKMLKEATELNNTIGIVAAYQSLSYNYQFTHRDDKALEVLEKARRLAPLCRDELLNSSIIGALISVCENLGDTQRRLKYIREEEALHKKMMARHPEQAFVLRGDMMLTYISYLKYYLFIGDRPNADRYSKLAKEYYSEDYTPVHKQLYHLTQCDYYTYIEAWENALQEADASAALLKPMFNINYYVALIQKANILSQSGSPTEAIALYKEVLAAKDSIQVVILNKQTEQIKNSYNTNLLLLEKERIQRQARLAFLIPLCMLIVLSFFFAVHIRRIGIKLRRAEREMGKMTQDVEQANLAKEKFLSNISTTIRGPLDTIVNNSLSLASDRIFDRAEKGSISEVITETSQELMTLINDILTLSKLEAGVMKYQQSTVGVVAFLRGMAGRDSVKNGIPVSVMLPENTEYEIRTDINLFAQMMDSLLSSLAEGCRGITLSLESTRAGKLRIDISGSGLAAKNQSQEMMIRNEINRMLLEHFSGVYEVHPGAAEPFVSLVLPIVRTVDLQ